MTADTLTVSCVQLTARDDDKEGTVDTCLRLIDRAAAQGAQLVVLPEVWTGLGYSDPDCYRRIAEPVPGPTTERLAAKAREHGLHIVGSLYAETPGGGYQNLAPLIGPNGNIIGSYVKTHLFDAPDRVDIRGGIRESDKVQAGDDLPVFDTDLGPLGVTVCSDLRFPEVYRVLTLRGARVVVCASAFLSPRLDHWEFFIRARAAENQVFVVASGQVGTEPVSGIGFVGRSMIADPWGTVVATASDTEGVVTSHLDLGLIETMRRRYPLLDQRRPDLYKDLLS
ncbi:nitrilase-related carbon-nitrogen hydrolase [Streptomyces sp. DSM 42041]|uniref:Nitrilase-related carbon-nitrogen hydrolase n=1 Tax=Streptomyces hazeniae TaxID=3075538 RepID=A0ABU2NM24_9ACTN|nr:nitrilase-related carbon-nitrogen hydrolase [Streptomyces sp. DSM 42041]MDT0377779.1 nitrilase-related carbon-nitrogen hydrolase [Streptomyces sp. DSM 42041]